MKLCLPMQEYVKFSKNLPFDIFHDADPEFHYHENNVDNCEIISCWIKMDLIKYMNTLIADTYVLKKYSDHLIFLQKLSKISS